MNMIFQGTRGKALAAGLVAAGLVISPVPTASAEQGAAPLRWVACAGEKVPAGMECATIQVPVDWARPGENKITLDLARLPATDPARRIGSVFTIPGGPGEDGIASMKQFADRYTALRRRFDVVTSTPRNSTPTKALPASCLKPGPGVSEPGNRREYEAQSKALARVVTTCRKEDRSGLFTRLDGLSMARDVEAVRAALGEERLSFMAWSAGGSPATAYARLFPHRIRAMYLDGVYNQPGGKLLWDRMSRQSFEKHFRGFVDWCARTSTCALHGEDAGKVWRKLLKDADRSPIPVTSAQFGKGKLTGFHLQVAVGLSAADPGAFATAVDKARHGDGSAFADNVLGLLAVYTQPIVLALRCPDGLGYTTYAEHREALREARRISPDMPYSTFDGLVCSGWKIPVANPARPLPVKGLPPFLGAGSQTDFPWTDSLTRTIPGSTSVLYDGPGHVMYLTGPKCVVEHADRYLTELKLPPAGTVCRA
ncbi:alpha/beta fold hydrolase [Streptosporangium subroseum]|uniref:alpha/beta fold hydrolase n=1 Tax=Streptosporangium subroseum TaxID=106412 RepID=UPI00343EA58D